ncbi:MAG: hypothetical protein WAO76_00630 [Georgfuchsia sp.]
MEVAFCNKSIYIIVYKSEFPIELFELYSGWGDLMQGDVAHQFRYKFNDLLASHQEVEVFAELVNDYSAIPSQSEARH